MHQGTKLVPAELIGFWQPVEPLGRHHDLLMANMFAPAEALAFGRHEDSLGEAGSPAEQIPHRVCEGNHPTTAILLDGLTPENLGKLIALYEHRVFIEGSICGIDPFDQWGWSWARSWRQHRAGTETGEAPDLSHDSSTTALIRRYRTKQGRAN